MSLVFKFSFVYMVAGATFNCFSKDDFNGLRADSKTSFHTFDPDLNKTVRIVSLYKYQTDYFAKKRDEFQNVSKILLVHTYWSS